jgi:RimJ/RimL family protein N-acetyltransferase
MITVDAIVSTMQLRPATPQDIPAIADLERIPEYHSFVGNWSLEEHHEKMTGLDCRYLIAEPESGEMAGFAILRGLASHHHSIRLQRIVVAQPEQGVGRFMLSGILDYVFGQLKAHRLWLDVFETNLRAQHVYESLGFRREGILREAIFRDGDFHTQILMSILEREYAATVGRHTKNRNL